MTREIEILQTTPRYDLVMRDGVAGIRCSKCGMTSWSPMDVEARYCRDCGFHDEPRAPEKE